MRDTFVPVGGLVHLLGGVEHGGPRLTDRGLNVTTYKIFFIHHLNMAPHMKLQSVVNYISVVDNLTYIQFHKTFPRSSLQKHWISVRFYEMGDTLTLWLCCTVHTFYVVVIVTYFLKGNISLLLLKPFYLLIFSTSNFSLLLFKILSPVTLSLLCANFFLMLF